MKLWQASHFFLSKQETVKLKSYYLTVFFISYWVYFTQRETPVEYSLLKYL
jgi:hypothetical protein